jgi:hypothetical protein
MDNWNSAVPLSRHSAFHDAHDAHAPTAGYLRESTLALRFARRETARRETDSNAKRKHNRAKRDTSSIQARVVFSENCARRGALSKANQAVTSNSMPNADPINIDLL